MQGRMSAAILAIAALVAAAAPAPRPRVLFAQGSWAALQFGARCEAAARPLPPATRRQPEARAGFAFGAPGRLGEFHARLSRIPRAGSSVMLMIGDRPFMLLA